MNYQERKAEVEDEQKTMTRQEIRDKMERESEFSLDLDNLPSVKHNWVQRGATVNCEGAGHAFHQHFLVERGKRKQLE